MIVLALIRDLFFRSKIDAIAAAASAQVEYASTIETAVRRCAEIKPAAIFVDLSDGAFPAVDAARQLRSAACDARLVGFASHVDLRPLKAAREAGFDQTLSRSEFTANLPGLLKTE